MASNNFPCHMEVDTQSMRNTRQARGIQTSDDHMVGRGETTAGIKINVETICKRRNYESLGPFIL